MCEEIAEKAELTGQMRSLLAWAGPGRKLTATGRIGLADARHLVELLATGDEIDREIGGRVFKTRSSEDLPRLTSIVGWAKAARLIRVTGNKLVPVKKHAALTERPLELVLALLDAFPWLGEPLFGNNWRPSLVGEEFPGISQRLLVRLLSGAGPIALDDLTEIARRTIEARYVLDDLPASQHDMLQDGIVADVMTTVTALQGLGVAVLDREADTVELTELGRFAIRRVRRMAQPGDPVIQLRVTLVNVDDPPVWRRLVIPADYTLDRVDGVIQAAMGWDNSHLHMFRIGGQNYGPAYLEGDIGTLDESQYRLGDVMKRRKRAHYEYDFGDSWEHELAVEARGAADDDTVYPGCTGGEGACPPEDCGGPYGFADLKEVLAGPPTPEREEMLEWAGEDYDPGHFDVAVANAAAGSV
jgi:Plasmid pRiA4b ORF-3-like protein